MEEVYKNWQKNVIDNFYINPTNQTSGVGGQIFLPKDGKPLYACKDKVIVVINYIENGVDNSTRVLNKDHTLPSKDSVKLYHIGEKKMNYTVNGVKDNDFIFLES